jgi:hypothetical protein
VLWGNPSSKCSENLAKPAITKAVHAARTNSAPARTPSAAGLERLDQPAFFQPSDRPVGCAGTEDELAAAATTVTPTVPVTVPTARNEGETALGHIGCARDAHSADLARPRVQ